MAENFSQLVSKADADPETEEEFLTDSESEEVETPRRSGPSNGVALLTSIPVKPDSKSKTRLASLDRKMMKFDKFLERVAYWPNKPPTVEELTIARDAWLKWEEARKSQVKRRGDRSAVMISFNIEMSFAMYWFFSLQ